ncbi:MAG: hypothetical protein ACRD6U_09105 [Nitrososphaeraceae archaeon]
MISYVSVISITLNQDQIVLAQLQQQQQQLQQLSGSDTNQSSSQAKQEQQPFLEDLSFNIDGLNFSHHTASVNGFKCTM